MRSRGGRRVRGRSSFSVVAHVRFLRTGGPMRTVPKEEARAVVPREEARAVVPDRSSERGALVDRRATPPDRDRWEASRSQTTGAS
jgi:hypothetical protein